MTFPFETEESYIKKCTCSDYKCMLDEEVISKLHDDLKVDLHRVEKALAEVRDIVQYKTSSSQDTLKHRYPLLLPFRTYGFVLKDREWHALHIDKIAAIKEDKQKFKDLILVEEHRDMVMSLVKMHSGAPSTSEGSANLMGQPQKRSELVRGKGNGLIILLHGVPGVGKTSTAECVAEYTRRPLYALTCGDIGETPTQVQANLQKAFTLAYKWNCVLLLDEADVFLAERGRADIKHNAVVSVFLRMLEYYSGILFLTTNEVGVFDDAFKSRIHLALYYDRLKLDQTIKIWKVNLKNLRINHPNIQFERGAILEWASDLWTQTQQNPWNGRQIHNAVRTAAALAAFKPDGPMKLKRGHFRKIEEASKMFDQYLEDTRGGRDEVTTAQMKHDRRDWRMPDQNQQPSGSPGMMRAQATHVATDRRIYGINYATAGQSMEPVQMQPVQMQPVQMQPAQMQQTPKQSTSRAKRYSSDEDDEGPSGPKTQGGEREKLSGLDFDTDEDN
ncbi:hypothetical protein LTR95_018210 [Oleoguttula sp. CCFEE 5521]